MRYRKLDENDDMVFGHGAADYWRDVPDAPAQAVKTRLNLRLGEWFLDTSAGTPYNTQILGKYTSGTRDMAVRTRILGTQGVAQIDSYSSSFDPNTREWFANATITTVYGPATLSEPL